MKPPLRYLLPLLMPLATASCNDEVDDADHDVDFCVHAAWHNGLDARSSRTLALTDILASGTDDIAIAHSDYPATIAVKCSDGTTFTLTKTAALCTDHSDYWQYTPSVIYKDKKIERDELTFSFTAVIDEDGDPSTTTDGDRLVGEADQHDITDKTSSGQRHILVTLHHAKALLRFAFKVNEKYDKVRFIRVTAIALNGTACQLVDKVLTTDGQLIAYAYVDPTVVTTAYTNTILCTYNIYDKDAVFPTSAMTEVEKAATETELSKHLTRQGVTAQNTFKLGALKDAGGHAVTQITPGYYYDLNVTLNPDYLYVLAEHDNKHITIE